MTPCTPVSGPKVPSNYKEVILPQGWCTPSAQNFAMSQSPAFPLSPPALHRSDDLAQASVRQNNAPLPRTCHDMLSPGACISAQGKPDSDGNAAPERERISLAQTPRQIRGAEPTAEMNGNSMKSQSPSPVTKPGNRYASLFLSDMHLGARSCRDTALLQFLQAHHADRIFLVGDIFDTWHGMGAHFNDTQHAIVQILLTRAQCGVEIVYTPGNHDAFFRQYLGLDFGTIKVRDHALHQTADGRRYLVIHGDSIDILVGRFPLLSRLAAKAENTLRGLGNFAQHWLRRFDLPITRQVDWLVARVNDLIRQQDDFQARLIDLAQSHDADGIICGHFHQPALIENGGITYANCGDWVENASALAETHAGDLVQLTWALTAERVPKHSLKTGLAGGV
jgi:UDP-2,3-diacylglucosamine pyrophosphatase LpxH